VLKRCPVARTEPKVRKYFVPMGVEIGKASMCLSSQTKEET
jgi:hypothetical protein